MVTKDRGRKWMWCCAGALVTLPFYFVRELITTFALFAIGFAAFAFAIVSLYMLQKGWEVAVARIVDSEHLAERGLRSPKAGAVDAMRTREETLRSIEGASMYFTVAGLKLETSESSCPERLTAGEGLRVNIV